MKKNKKAALTLAVLSALSPIMNIGTVAEAQTTNIVRYDYASKEIGYFICAEGHVSDGYCSDEWVSMGKINGNNNLNPNLDNITDSGRKAIKDTVAEDINSAKNTAESNAKDYTDKVAAGKANINLDNINGTGKQVIKDTVATDISNAKADAQNNANRYTDSSISNLENRAKVDAAAKAASAEANAKSDAAQKVADEEARAKSDATNKANTAESNAKSYTDILNDATKTYAKTYTDEVVKGKANIGLDNINEHGEQVIRNIAKDEMKNSGIDTTGDTIVVDKPMKTKDIYVDGKIDTTGDAHIGGNITVDGNSHVKGDSEVDGDSHIHGSESINKDLNVKEKTTTGELEVTGKSTFDGDTETKGNATFDKDVTVKGKTTTSELEVTGDSTFDGNTETKGSATVDKDLTVHGNETVDGNSHVKGTQAVDGDATFGKNVYVAGVTSIGALISRGDAAIGGNLTTVGNADFKSDVHVAGNQTVDGDIYGKSFNVGNERYIDKDGVNANDHKVRNVTDGEVSATSKDAVNGSQLYRTAQELSARLGGNIDDMNRRLTGNISEVAAQSAAMAGLHPLEWDKNDKVTISTSVGSYKSNSAMAVGAFYRPDKQSMISLQGAVGSNNNMYSLGYSQKLGKVSELENLTDKQLKDRLTEIGEENKVIKTKNANLENNVNRLSESNENLQNELTSVKSDNAGLKENVSTLQKAYQAVQGQLKALMEKLAGK